MPAPPPQAAPPSAPDDHALLRAFVAGDQSAFAILLRRHERMVFSVSLRVLSDPASARDAAQQTFLLLARHAARLRPPVVIGGWLYHTARHQAETLRRSMQRRHLRELRAAADLYDSSTPEPSTSAHDPAWSELSPRLDAALDSLPARLRDAVVLCLLENHDRATAAAQLGCSPDAIAKRLTRALDQLRARLPRPGKPVTAAALAVLLTQHGSESHAATLAPAVLATPLAPAAPTGLAIKLATTAALLVLGAMFVIRTLAPVQPSSLPGPTSNPSAPAARDTEPKRPTAATPAPQPSAAHTPDLKPVDPLAQIPDNNPYKPALLAYARLAAAKDSGVTLSSEQQQAARNTVIKSLAAGRVAAEVDWGVDYSRGFSTIIPHVGPANQLAKAVIEELTFFATAGNTADLALDVIALGRHLGREGALIEILTGIAVTQRALDQLEPLIADLPPADAARLAAELRKLPALGTLATTLAYEKAFFIDGFTHELTEELATALAKLEAPGPSDAAAPGSDAALARALAGLHLHGLITEGSSTRVGLRSPDRTFWLSSGEARYGVRLLSANVAQGKALLLVEGRPVALDLVKGTFDAPSRRFLETVARSLPPNSLAAFVLKHNPPDELAGVFSAADASADELTKLYEEAIAHPDRFLNPIAYRERVKQLSPIAQTVAVSLPGIIKKLQSHAAREAALLDQLDARAAAPR